MAYPHLLGGVKVGQKGGVTERRCECTKNAKKVNELKRIVTSQKTEIVH